MTTKAKGRLLPPPPETAADNTIDTTVATIVFQIPGADTPGFLRRQRVAVALMEEAKNPTTNTIWAIADFLQTFIVEPVEPDKAREALEDLSQSQFNQMLNAIISGKQAADVPLESNDK